MSLPTTPSKPQANSKRLAYRHSQDDGYLYKGETVWWKVALSKAFAIHSYKGGTGKSCITTSLAAVLALKGKNICLLDYDLRGPSLYTLFKGNTAQYWLNDYLDGLCEVKEAVTDVSSSLGTKGKFLIGLADPSAHRIREMLVKDRRWEQKALQKLLGAKEELFTKMKIDYLFFDTSPGLQYSSINAIVAADVVVLLTKVDAFDFAGTSRMIPEIYQLLEKKVGMIINQVVPGIEPQVKEVTQAFKLPLLGKIPLYADESTYLLTKHVLPIQYPKHQFTTHLQDISDNLVKLAS